MIDMGLHKGQRVFYTEGKSLADLISEGQIFAVPDRENGIVFKRAVNCSELEKAAAFSLEELRALKAQQDGEL